MTPMPPICSRVYLLTKPLFLTGVLILLGSFNHPAKSKEPTFYQIELIAFEHAQLPSALAEQWPPYTRRTAAATDHLLSKTIPRGRNKTPNAGVGGETDLDDPGAEQATLTDQAILEEFQPLDAAQLQMKDVVTRLKQRRLARRILLHTAWQQRMGEANHAPRVWLSSESHLKSSQPAAEQLLDSTYFLRYLPDLRAQTAGGMWQKKVSQQQFDFSGTVSFYKTRYPRLETNLCLTIDQFRLPDAYIVKRPELNPLNTVPTRFVDICSRETSGLTFGRPSYFDTPVLGLLVLVTEVEAATNLTLKQ